MGGEQNPILGVTLWGCQHLPGSDRLGPARSGVRHGLGQSDRLPPCPLDPRVMQLRGLCTMCLGLQVASDPGETLGVPACCQDHATPKDCMNGHLVHLGFKVCCRAAHEREPEQRYHWDGRCSVVPALPETEAGGSRIRARPGRLGDIARSCRRMTRGCGSVQSF